MEPVEENITPACASCTFPIAEGDRYCTNCGKLHLELPPPLTANVFSIHTRWAVIFYLADLVACLVASRLEFFHTYEHLIWIEGFMALWAIGFAAFIWKDLSPLFSFRNVRFDVAVLLAVLAVGASVVVNITVDWLNETLFYTTTNFYWVYADMSYPKIFMYLSVALYPAIFEELAYRGVVFHHVRQITGRRNTVIISSMAFAIIHISVISFYWLIPFALALGYLRNRYNTLWYGIIVHFTFNATACTMDLLNLSL